MTPVQVFSCEFCAIFQKFVSTEHQWITAPADSSFFKNFIIDNCNYGNLFRKALKMKIFLLITIIYPKVNMNVKAILPRQ